MHHPPPFRETQHIPRKIFLVLLLVEFGTLVITFTVLATSNAPAWVYAVVVAALLTPPALIALPKLRITLDHDALKWSWHPFGWGSIPYHRIANAQPITVDPLNHYGGWGPKCSRKRKEFGFGLIARGPHAVRITWTDKARPTVITTDDPETLATRILEHTLNTQHPPGDTHLNPEDARSTP